MAFDPDNLVLGGLFVILMVSTIVIGIIATTIPEEIVRITIFGVAGLVGFATFWVAKIAWFS